MGHGIRSYSQNSTVSAPRLADLVRRDAKRPTVRIRHCSSQVTDIVQNPESRIQNPDVEQAGILRRSRIFTESLRTDAQQAEFGIENHQFQNSIAAAPRLSFEQNSRWALHGSQNLGLRNQLNSDAGFTREFERHVQLSQNFTWSSHLNFRVRIFRRAFN